MNPFGYDDEDDVAAPKCGRASLPDVSPPPAPMMSHAAPPPPPPPPPAPRGSLPPPSPAAPAPSRPLSVVAAVPFETARDSDEMVDVLDDAQEERERERERESVVAASPIHAALRASRSLSFSSKSPSPAASPVRENGVTRESEAAQDERETERERESPAPPAPRIAALREELRAHTRHTHTQPAQTTKYNLPSLRGLHSAVSDGVEVPADLLRRVLLQNEIVVGQFDVYYPHREHSARVKIALTWLTLGVYWLYRALRSACIGVRHALCGSCLWCVDEIFFTRGKLFVTSKGRVVWWEQTTQQVHSLCGDVVQNVQSETTVLNVDDIAQIRLSFSHQRLLCGFCLSDHVASVDLTFHAFCESPVLTHAPSSHIHASNLHSVSVLTQYFATVFSCLSSVLSSLFLFVFACVPCMSSVCGDVCGSATASPTPFLTSRYLYTAPKSTFVAAMNAFLVDWDVFRPLSCGAESLREREPVTIRVVSHSQNYVYDADTSVSRQETWEDLLRFHEHVNSVLTNCKNSCVSVRDEREENTNHNPRARLNPPVFLSPRELVDEQIRSNLGNDVSGVLMGIKEFHNELSNFSLVDEMGQVTVPLRWLSLSQGEECIAAVGQYHFPHFLTKLWAIVSLQWLWGKWSGGMCCGGGGESRGDNLIGAVIYGRSTVLNGREKERSALILTTHRLVEIIVKARRGRVGAEVVDMEVCVTSYYPKQIESGFVSTQNGYTVTSALLTKNGLLSVCVPSNHLAFAQKMQMAISRAEKIVSFDKQDLLSLLPSQHTQTSAAPPTQFYESREFLPIEKLVLPLLPAEQCVHRFTGGVQYAPQCLLPHDTLCATRGPLPFLCSLVGASPAQDRERCLGGRCSTWAGCVSLCTTCGCSAARTAGQSVALSDNALFFTQFSSRQSKGCSLCTREVNILPPLQPTRKYTQHCVSDKDMEREGEGESVTASTAGEIHTHPCAAVLCGCCFYDHHTASGGAHSRGVCECCGPAQRYRLQPFVALWTPLGRVDETQCIVTQHTTHAHNAKQQQQQEQKRCVCEREGEKETERESERGEWRCRLTVHTDLGLSLSLGDRVHGARCVRERERARVAALQSVLGAVQQTQTHNDRTLAEMV